MNFFGLGGFEILLIGAIALFVLGPKRMLEAVREGRKIYRDLQRQRNALQTMISEAIDLEDIKKQIDADGLKESVKSLEKDLALDQVEDEIRKATDAATSISRDVKLTSSPSQKPKQTAEPQPNINPNPETEAKP